MVSHHCSEVNRCEIRAHHLESFWSLSSATPSFATHPANRELDVTWTLTTCSPVNTVCRTWTPVGKSSRWWQIWAIIKLTNQRSTTIAVCRRHRSLCKPSILCCGFCNSTILAVRKVCGDAYDHLYTAVSDTRRWHQKSWFLHACCLWHMMSNDVKWSTWQVLWVNLFLWHIICSRRHLDWGDWLGCTNSESWNGDNNMQLVHTPFQFVHPCKWATARTAVLQLVRKSQDVGGHQKWAKWTQ